MDDVIAMSGPRQRLPTLLALFTAINLILIALHPDLRLHRNSVFRGYDLHGFVFAALEVN